MQTFLPYPDFRISAYVLDQRRLGKQRVETLQIMQTIIRGSGWNRHPAVMMWFNYPLSLFMYQRAICSEWQARGFNDTCLEKTFNVYSSKFSFTCSVKEPPWLHDEAFHKSHRSNLLRKDPVHYRRFGWTESDNLPYIWPT